MERWTANKFGLLNFWLYDEAEFKLSNGKIIFRGTNGSGKSVTTQSFIPLLLDGDKRPSRLDPFGSTARKIENYVLVNEGEEDRISYLYMEFNKPESKNYITIGMGLRGRKGKKLESWYFILKDGRRINKDFKLYKFSGEKYPLTLKQLKNQLGDGNIFTTSQKEYMEKVNEHLFGYSDIDNYKDLLNLLIQIRSPKLSKDFKPTVIYEILKESLNTLSQDDLRAMAEALDNMDSLNLKLRELNESVDAIEKVKKAFDEYNLSILHNKSKRFMKKSKEVTEIRRVIREEERKIRTLLSNINEKKIELDKMERDFEQAKEKEVALRTSEAFNIKNEITKYIQEILQMNKELENKEGKRKKKFDGQIKQEDEIRDLELKIYKNEQKFKDFLQDEEYYREEAFFYHNDDLSKVLKDFSQNFDFKNIEIQLYEYENVVRSAFEVLKEAENIKKDLNDMEERHDKQENVVKTKENKLNESKAYLTSIKDEYIEKINKYIDNLKVFKINDNDKIQICKFVNEIYEIADFTLINDKLKEIESNIKLSLAKEKIVLKNSQNQIKEKIRNIQNNIDELENNEEIIVYDEDMLKAKDILNTHNIPCEYFYKVVDFNDLLQYKEKNIIEANLYNMGILTSIIVPSKYKKEALALMKNISCKIIFDDVKSENENILKYLKLDDTEFNKNFKETVEKILMSISLVEINKSKTFVSNYNEYAIGIINGVSSEEFKAKYIGIESRERFRKEKINKLEEEKEEALNEDSKLTYKINEINKKIGILENEKNNFPKGNDIISSINIIIEDNNELEKEKKELLFVKEKIEKLNKQNLNIKRKLYKACEHIKIPNTVKCYENALNDISQYRKVLNNLKEIFQEIIYNKKSIEKAREYYKEILDDLDTISGEINDLKSKINSKKNIIVGKEEALKSFNLGEIEQEIEKVTKIINTYPKIINDLSKEITRSESDIEYSKKFVSKNKEKFEREKEILDILKNAIIEEINLEYINEIEHMEFDDILNWAISRESISKENFENLFNVFNQNENYIIEYHPKIEKIFNDYEDSNDEEKNQLLESSERYDIKIKFNNKNISIYELSIFLNDNLNEQKILINEKERDVFENTLINTLSTKISAKIFKASAWVKEIDSLMKNMDTTSGFKLYLNWKPKKSEGEEELDIKDLTNILKTPDFMNPEDRERISKHFNEKLKKEKRIASEDGSKKSYQSIIKEVLDYRKWFEFQLSFSKSNERKKELTDSEFFKLSGGEKAMAMYIPLFAAVNARYNAADKKDCPRIISLDEAFAGVDEENISNMFTLIEGLNLDYVLNSQILWGTYESVSSLSIYELIRDDKDIVLPIKYHWDGHVKKVEMDV